MCVFLYVCHTVVLFDGQFVLVVSNLAYRRHHDDFLGRHCCDETAAEEDGNEGLHGPAKVLLQ